METGASTNAVIGIDLGGTKLLAGVFDANHQLLATERIPVAGLDSAGLVDAMADVVERLRAVDGVGEVSAIGCGIPTTIDQRTGIAVQAANLPLEDLPLRDLLEQRTGGVPVLLDNDANVAALAEARQGAGASRQAEGGTTDLLMVTLGTGFGGGIIAGGRILRGAIGAGAELGHVSIDMDGRACVSANCPGIGCIEAYVGGNALRYDAAELIEREPDGALASAVRAGAPATGETVLQLANDGDASCVRLLETMGMRFGIGLAGFVNIFNPRLIVVGGGLTPTLPYLLPPARRELEARALRPGNTYAEIVEAEFGPDAGMFGAAYMARDGVLERAHA